MTNKDKTRCGRIHVTWRIEFHDPDLLADAVERIADATKEIGEMPHATAQCGLSYGGRRPLSEAEWERRFSIVRRIIESKKRQKITLLQACAAESVPYSSFRCWRQKMESMKGVAE